MRGQRACGYGDDQQNGPARVQSRSRQAATDRTRLIPRITAAIPSVPVSARSGEGVERLLELPLQVDVMEFKATPIARRAYRGRIGTRSRPRAGRDSSDSGRHAPSGRPFVAVPLRPRGDPGSSRSTRDRGGSFDSGRNLRPVERTRTRTTLPFVVEARRASRGIPSVKAARGRMQKTSRVSLEDLSSSMPAGEVKELHVSSRATSTARSRR